MVLAEAESVVDVFGDSQWVLLLSYTIWRRELECFDQGQPSDGG